MKHLLQKTFALKALLLMSLLVGAVSGAWAEEKTFDFSFTTIGTTGWSNSYAAHSYIFDEGTVKFTSASKQTGTITTVPVTKGQPVEFVMKEGYTISAATFKCTQWGTKAQTITLNYSTDGGETYESTGVTSTNFEISSNGLPSGTNAVKITFSSTSNQVGITSATITYANGGGDDTELEDCDLTLTDAPIALTFDMYNNSQAQYISYTTSSTGEITAASNAAVSCYADPETQTISVTPFASTNGEPLVITLNQAADDNYKAGSVTFTVTVTDSTPIPTHIVTFSNNGTTSTEEFEEGKAITFPTNINDIEGKSFVGWVTSEITGTTDEAPTFVTSAQMGQSDVTYYAVFATKSGSVEPKTLTITPETENFPTSYADANDYTLEGKKFNILQAYINGSKLQWRKYGDTNGTGTMYNVDALSNIQSIVLTYDQSDNNKNFTVVVGYTKNPKNVEITPTHTGSVYTYDCSSGDTYNYFVMTNGSGAGYLQSITINYQEGSMSLSGYCTTVAADTRKDAELSFSLSEANAAIGAAFEQPTLTTAEGFNGTIEYSSSDENVAQIMDTETGELRIVGEGTTTITATFEGNDDFKRGSASYTLTVTDNRIATTISQEPIELDLADIATLTRLAPVVKDAEGNIVEYTNSPDAEGLPEVYFEIVSDDNGIFGSFDSHGNIVLNSVEGTATIKAVYNNFRLNETYKPSECTFTITVTDSHAPGAVNNPYTVELAIAAIDAGTGVNGVYATGIVSKIVTAYSTDYRNITFDISDDGQETSNQLRAYRCVGTDAADVQVGDIVVVYGDLTKYDQIYEFAQKNQLVSLKRPASISITPDTYNMDAKAGGGELPVVCKNLATEPQLEIIFVDADGETVVTYDWITAEINENGNINGQITENSGEARTAYFYVKGVDANGDVVKSNLVTFTQEARVTEPFITVNTETWDVDYNGEEKTFGFDYDNLGSNPTFAVQFFESDGTTETGCGWISARFATDDNKVTIIVINNDETSARTAYFKIYAEVEKTKVYSNLVTINQAKFVVDYAELPFEFDGGKANIASTTGLTQEGLSSDYSSSPKLKFDSTDDYIILKINERPGTLTFDIKGNSFSGGTFTVQTSEDGVTYTDLKAYTELNSTTESFDKLDENVRYIKWIYTEKVSGNVALGNINLAKPQLPKAGLSFGETTSFVITLGDEFTAPTLTNPNEVTVTYKSSNEDVALVNSETGVVTIKAVGTANITATFAGNETYSEGSASYTINVLSPNYVATPIITLGSTNFFTSTTATITCETEGASIKYSTDNGETWLDYTEVLTLTETTTLIAKAVKNETESEVAEASTATKYEVLEGLAELVAKTNTSNTNYYVNLTNAQVTYVDGKNGFMEDATTGIYLYSLSDLDLNKVYNGIFEVTYQVYNKLPEIKTAITAIESEGATITDGEAKEATVITLNALEENWSENLGRKVKLEDITLENASMLTATISIADKTSSLEYGKTYDLVGYAYFNKGEQQFYVVSSTEDERTVATLAFQDESGNDITTIELKANDAAVVNIASNIDASEIIIKSSDNEVAEWSDGIYAYKAGTAIFTATIAANEEHTAATATLTATVVDKYTATISFASTPTTIEVGEGAAYAATTNSSATITYKSSDENIVMVDENGYILGVAVGTATITASVAANDDYTEASKSYEVTVTGPKNYVALVAEYNGKHYALTNNLSNGTYAATEVDAVNGKVVSKRSDNIAWEIIEEKATIYIANKAKDKNGYYQYIGHGSSTTLTRQSATSDAASKWTADTENKTWVSSERSFIYRESANGFKNYATSNAGSSDYGSYTTAYTFADGYTRNVTAGNWGTFCVDHTIAVADYSGVTFYSIAGKQNKNNEPTALILKEETDDLLAGVAYIFQANEDATKLIAAFSDESIDKPFPAEDNNGLVGSFTGTTVEPGKYVLFGGEVVKAGENVTIGANRAYIDMDAVDKYFGDITSAGVKVFYLGGADAIRSLDADSLNGAAIYDLSGRRLNKAQKGLYIVNGKKVSVK